jgi:hypothetical protein
LQPVIEAYIPVLLGLTQSEPLDTAVSFGWTNRLSHEAATELNSAKYELVSVFQAMAVAFVGDAEGALQTRDDKEGKVPYLCSAIIFIFGSLLSLLLPSSVFANTFSRGWTGQGGPLAPSMYTKIFSHIAYLLIHFPSASSIACEQ